MAKLPSPPPVLDAEVDPDLTRWIEQPYRPSMLLRVASISALSTVLIIVLVVVL